MSRTLPTKINLLAYSWLRAQVLQYMLNPLARDGNLALMQRYSPTHVKMSYGYDPKAHSDIHDAQYQTMRSILTLGYRSDHIKFEPYHSRMNMGGTPILVDIDYQGDIILLDGAHRILFQLVSGATEIWADVRTRSYAWIDFVERADSIADGFAYAKLPHPDFDDCPCARKETRVSALYEAIKNLNIKSAVDLGCCSGAFACDLSVVVPEVHGIDLDQRFVDLAWWRAGKTGSQATFSQGSLLDYRSNAEMVCVLSVLHHVIKAQGLVAVTDWLTTLSCKYLLLEYPTPNESILQNSPEGLAFAQDLVGSVEGCDFHLIADMGVDPGFAAVARHLLLFVRT